MRTRSLLIILFLASIALAFLPISVSVQDGTVPNPDVIVYAKDDYVEPETVDPAILYSAASGELIQNIYETLVTCDGECVDSFLPQLATEWVSENVAGTTSPEGLLWYHRYIFKIRTAVYFHDGSLLTPEDVEYSFERTMVLNSPGYSFMFYEALLNGEGADFIDGSSYNLSVTEGIIRVGRMIDHSVESNETHVWFNLAFPGAYVPFLQLLSQSWSSILSRKWMRDQVISVLGRRAWSGDWGDYSNWIEYHDPEVSPLDSPSPVMDGTGPFMLEKLDYTNNYWSAVRNPNYWGGWPASWPSPPYPSSLAAKTRPKGYVERCVVTWGYAWETRRDLFIAGTIDLAAVPAQCTDQVADMPGIRCFSNLPSLLVSGLLFTFCVNETSPYLGTPGGLPHDTFNESGIPADFFSDLHVRKAFAYSFNFSRLNEVNLYGQGVQLSSWCPAGVPYWNANGEVYNFDLAKATEEFKLAWNGKAWENGFSVTTLWPYSSSSRYWNIFNIIKAGIEGLNPKFHVEWAEGQWYELVRAQRNGMAPIFSAGWLGDFADPDCYARGFMHTSSSVVLQQRYGNETLDDLVDEGIETMNNTRRQEIYFGLQQKYHEDCPDIFMYQMTVNHYERDWVQGWYHNPNYPGIYFYPLWKKRILQGDVNFDGTINILDVTLIAKAFGSYFGPPMHPCWNFRCDLNSDKTVNIVDLTNAAKNFGHTG